MDVKIFEGDIKKHNSWARFLAKHTAIDYIWDIKIVIVNGLPGVGKTTLENAVKSISKEEFGVETLCYSMVDAAKNLLNTNIGFKDLHKDKKYRKLVSDIKEAIDEFCDASFIRVISDITERLQRSEGPVLIFVDSRDISDTFVNKFKDIYGEDTVKTLLVSRRGVTPDKVYGNKADDWIPLNPDDYDLSISLTADNKNDARKLMSYVMDVVYLESIKKGPADILLKAHKDLNHLKRDDSCNHISPTPPSNDHEKEFKYFSNKIKILSLNENTRSEVVDFFKYKVEKPKKSYDNKADDTHMKDIKVVFNDDKVASVKIKDRLEDISKEEESMKESKYQAMLIKLLQDRYIGSIVMKQDAKYKQGIPDLVIFYKGRYAMLEVKENEKSDRQANQEYYINLVNNWAFARFIYPENQKEVLGALDIYFGGDE